MSGLLQSGQITPGHAAKWVTDGVLADGGPLGSTQQVLAYLLSADFNTLSDQALLLPTSINAFMVTGIVVTNAPTSLSLAVGGFYPQAAKAGVALVANTQIYSTLTSTTKLLSCTLTAGANSTRYSVGNVPDWAIYLSLTTAQGGDATADVYLLGIDLTA